MREFLLVASSNQCLAVSIGFCGALSYHYMDSLGRTSKIIQTLI